MHPHQSLPHLLTNLASFQAILSQKIIETTILKTFFLRIFLHHFNSLFYLLVVRLYGLCNNANTFLCFFPVPLLDRFADTSQGFYAIAGIITRCIDLVLVPGAARQAIWIYQ